MRSLFVALGLALTAAAHGQAPPPAAPALAFEDQFERPVSVAAHRGDVVVLLYGDRKSAEANRELGERLHVAFHPSARGLPPARARQAPVLPLPEQPPGTRAPDVLAVPVACVGKVPGVVRAVIRGQVRGASPDVPVWLDFQDTMRQQFGLAARVPNLVVLDAAGRVRYRAAGPLTAEQFNRLVAFLDALRREASAASPEAPGKRGQVTPDSGRTP
jgi:hypothetical protein